MKVLVEFECESAAFYEYLSDEVRQVMEQATDKIINATCGPSGFALPLRDTNGNTVGRVKVTL